MTSTRGYALTPYTWHNMSQIDAIAVTLVCQKLKWPSDFNYRIKHIEYAIAWSYEPDEILENKTYDVRAMNQIQCGCCLCLIYRILLVFNSLLNCDEILGNSQSSIMKGFSPNKCIFHHLVMNLPHSYNIANLQGLTQIPNSAKYFARGTGHHTSAIDDATLNPASSYYSHRNTSIRQDFLTSQKTWILLMLGPDCV